MLLRQSTTLDIPWIVAFMQQHYPPAYAYLWEDDGDWYLKEMYNADKLTEEFADEHAVFYQVIQFGKPIGFCKIIFGKRPENEAQGTYLYLQRLYLSSEVQGLGIGSQVMDFLHDLAGQKQYDYCWLESMKVGDARRFYERKGYKVIDEIRLPFPGMIDDSRALLVMVKKINEPIS